MNTLRKNGHGNLCVDTGPVHTCSHVCVCVVTPTNPYFVHNYGQKVKNKDVKSAIQGVANGGLEH